MVVRSPSATIFSGGRSAFRPEMHAKLWVSVMSQENKSRLTFKEYLMALFVVLMMASFNYAVWMIREQARNDA